jgi:hypothetical protein
MGCLALGELHIIASLEPLVRPSLHTSTCPATLSLRHLGSTGSGVRPQDGCIPLPRNSSSMAVKCSMNRGCSCYTTLVPPLETQRSTRFVYLRVLIESRHGYRADASEIGENDWWGCPLASTARLTATSSSFRGICGRSCLASNAAVKPAVQVTGCKRGRARLALPVPPHPIPY